MSELTIDEFFAGHEDSRKLFEALSREVNRLGEVTVRFSKSQAAFRRRKNLAVAWIPGQYLKVRPTAPLVLTISFPVRDPSPRWKEITETGRGRFTHHLELYRVSEIDDEVRDWLHAAWEQAGR